MHGEVFCFTACTASKYVSPVSLPCFAWDDALQEKEEEPPAARSKTGIKRAKEGQGFTRICLGGLQAHVVLAAPKSLEIRFVVRSAIVCRHINCDESMVGNFSRVLFGRGRAVDLIAFSICMCEGYARSFSIFFGRGFSR